jgi:hypothetical protein
MNLMQVVQRFSEKFRMHFSAAWDRATLYGATVKRRTSGKLFRFRHSASVAFVLVPVKTLSTVPDWLLSAPIKKLPANSPAALIDFSTRQARTSERALLLSRRNLRRALFESGASSCRLPVSSVDTGCRLR